MFLRYYNLREQPFGMTPDPRFLYLSASHREALASLIYGIETGRGFVGLIAEPGMGKTTLLFQLMERLQNSARTVFLFQTQANTHEFLSNLIADLGLDPSGQDVASLQRQLNEILIREAQMGRQFVLIIDEAQNLENSVLESVRMLSNFETSRSKLMQIVLAGQPPLADKLARPELEQLRQRVSIICRLDPFTREEVADYISHRLKTAGYNGGQLFTPEALSILAEQSGGIPRNINNLCFHALSLGYAEGQKNIGPAIMEEVLNDLNLDSVKDRRAHHQAKHGERHNEPGGLEGVTLNGGARAEEDDEFRILFRGAAHPSSSARRGSVAGGRRPTPKSPRWLFWAVALLTLVLAGEVFWAYIPTDTSPHAITQFIDAAVGRAKQVALKHQLLKENGSHAQKEPKPTFVNSNASNSDGLSQRQGVSSPDASNSVNVAPRAQQSNAPSDEKAGDTSEDSKPSAGVPAPAVIQKPSGSRAPGISSADHFQAPAYVAKGKIVLESNVNGGAITINGRSRPGWQTPYIFTLPSGTYRISISKSGYSTWFRDVRVTGGNKKWIVADLRAPRGVVVIDTEPPGMQVFIDGKPYGPSEVETSLSIGTHTYKVVPPGGRRPLQGTFVLKPGAILTRKIQWLSNGDQHAAQNSPDSEQRRNKTNSPAGRVES